MSRYGKIILSIFLLITAALLARAWLDQTHSEPSTKIYQIGCTLVDKNLSILKKFNGHLCTFLKNGDAIVALPPATIMYFSRMGEIIWSDSKTVNHHKLLTSNNEESFIGITSESKIMNKKKIRADVFYVRDFKNKILKRWSTFENLEYFISLNLKQLSGCSFNCFWVTDWFPDKVEKFSGELTHANSIQEISAKEEVIGSKIWKSGNYLVYLYGPLGMALVIDSSMKKILWSLDMIAFNRPNIHDLQIIPGGRLLYFVNSNVNDKFSKQADNNYSSVEIIDIKTLKLLWSYSGDGKKFYSQYRGSAQQLENGNILLTESWPKLQAREISQDKRTVFEFISPLLDQSNNQIAYQEIKQIDADEFLRNNK